MLQKSPYLRSSFCGREAYNLCVCKCTALNMGRQNFYVKNAGNYVKIVLVCKGEFAKVSGMNREW